MAGKKDLKNAFSGLNIQGSALTIPHDQRVPPVRPPSYLGTSLTAVPVTDIQPKREEKVLQLPPKKEQPKEVKGEGTAQTKRQTKPVAAASVANIQSAPSSTTPKPSERISKIEKLHRVNVFLDKAEKKSAEDLAEELQTRKSRARLKGEGTLSQERITANTVIRVALNHFLSNFELQDFDLVDSEDQLLELTTKRLKR